MPWWAWLLVDLLLVLGAVGAVGVAGWRLWRVFRAFLRDIGGVLAEAPRSYR